MSRVDNFCTSSILDNLYSCTDGLCEKSSSPIGKGNYVVEVSTGNFNLFLCDYDSGSSGPVTCVKDTEGTLNGLIVVQDTDNEDNYKVIKSISKTELVAITDISKVGDLFLYDCENGVCQRTDGFVKYGESLANTASCSTGSKCAVAAADLTITGIAVIDYTDFKFYDISDTSKETVKYTVAVNKEYFYKKDNDNFVLIKTANDGESSLMIIGVAKFIGSSVIADTVSFEVVASCQQSTQTTYTISGSITNSVACVITNPCDLASVDAQYCAEKGYYLRKGDGDLADSGSATGTLYYCSTATTCGVAPSVGIGLYKNADTITAGRPEYIKCSGSSSGCIAVAVKEVVNDNDCSTSGVVIGDIIKFTSSDLTPVTTYKLCLTGTTTAKTVLLSSSDSAPTDIESRFFIEISNNNAFGNENEKFVLIEVNSDGSILKNGAKTIKYRYTNADFKVRYRNDKSDVCNNNGTANEGIVEFALDGDNDYYIKKTSN
ncbi:hypothetical protein H8356DRAFT_1294353 [Neocallimastix lanati (nom. inval.)]|nr:hypothetical protein H8356DRAFT_1294353 [Neocallimastix sp. JGI-2020a]